MREADATHQGRMKSMWNASATFLNTSLIEKACQPSGQRRGEYWGVEFLSTQARTGRQKKEKYRSAG